ncbi:PRTRC system ParB family protein [Acidithiobacillus sp.]|uniref:PRTRC system ParB family protein n=1 Tax=Acidithiobacillus sp. TaxID=1872118 RepID=UPI00260B63B7|nr:PRTRC system ParB family protein [Acidithiobacillus sp.]MDD2751220.1 PRTRC system ParB family protein [Acidithiobacillus sp.]MDD5278698.1 PRTRC system ParB family protein [Acidithiobacillus sp.]
MKVATQNITVGHNPRRFFDPSEMEDLKNSIESIGLLQPVVLKDKGDGNFLLIAGERRLRAWREIYGEDSEIPATIPDDQDIDVEVASLVENTLRADMSPTEESRAAYALVMRLKGDMDEACRLLGWKPEFLKRRLALQACHPDVAQALDERKILLGHAELLATIGKEKQQKALGSVIGKNISVADLKKSINNIAQELASAIFDKTDCATCQYNSDQQSSLFAETVDSGRCTGVNCFSEKTKEELQLRASKLESKYPVVKLVSAENEGTYTPVGAETVGDEAFVACQACANFGAGVSESPASLGEVSEGLCFDLACNQKKVAAFAASNKPAPQPQTATTVSSAAGSTHTTASSQKTQEKPVRSDKIMPSGSLITYRRNAWNVAAKKFIIENDPEIATAIIITAVTTKNVANAKITEAAKAIFGNSPSVSDVWNTACPDAKAEKKHGQIRQALAYAIVMALEQTPFREIMESLGVRLADYWQINEEFLALLTKNDLELLATEIALPTTPKMFSGKKADCISEIMLAEGKGFDFKGIVPQVMSLN